VPPWEAVDEATGEVPEVAVGKLFSFPSGGEGAPVFGINTYVRDRVAVDTEDSAPAEERGISGRGLDTRLGVFMMTGIRIQLAE
ncbi:MAG: hypothetical protein AAF658_16405, partial [Myxococcota bacterium]